MTKTKQELENYPIANFEEKIARAKKLLQIYNDITFGNKVEATESKLMLRQMM